MTSSRATRKSLASVHAIASGIGPLNAFKMAVICLIGSMLFDDGVTDDQRFLLNAHGISLLTQVGLADLGISEKLEDGPVMPRDERIRAVQAPH